MFISGTMFGDSDIFAKLLNITQNEDGREMTAVSMADTSLFRMNIDVVL